MHGRVNIVQNSLRHCDVERKSNLRQDLENLFTSNIQLWSTRRATLVGIDDGTIDGELKLRERLGQCIWTEIKWSREMKLGEKEINTKIRAMSRPQMKW